MKNKLFWSILLLAFILRFYKLGNIPKGLDWDENSNAYNAYSILKTGRDEYGKILPLYNRSFDDYKPPLYMYTNVISVAIFGLTPFAARMPSALFGFLTVPVVYFLAKWLSRSREKEISEKFSLLAMFLVTVSPWHIGFSRVGFEANLGLFVITFAITSFLYGLNNKRPLVLSAILIGLSFYSYHAERIFTPFILLALIIIWRSQIIKIPKKYLFCCLAILISIALPLITFAPKQVLLQRFETTSSGPTLDYINKSISFIEEDSNSKIAKIIHNRRFLIAQGYLANYLAHFDLNFLFTKGDDNPRHHIENMGMIYLFELPLILSGLYFMIKNRSKENYFVLLWLIFAPLPAAPANPSPHAIRSEILVIPLELISAAGLLLILQLLDRQMRKSFIILSSLIITVSILVYLHNYYVHYAINDASFWQYGYSQAAEESLKLKNQYKKINVDSSIEQAYIFWLFNTKFDPRTYQSAGSKLHFDKYYFNAQYPQTTDELFITTTTPENFDIIKTIYYPNGNVAVNIGHHR